MFNFAPVLSLLLFFFLIVLLSEKVWPRFLLSRYKRHAHRDVHKYVMTGYNIGLYKPETDMHYCFKTQLHVYVKHIRAFEVTKCT